MTRRPRVHMPYTCHHVILRGTGGRNLFIDDVDRVRFCLLLQRASEKHLFKVHSFCLMSNHIHLVIEPTTIELAKCEHAFAARYAQYFNRRHDRQGYLYQGRYRSILVENGLYLRRLIRYVHLNPVEAGLVSLPEHYRWSSHRAYLQRDAYTWLHTDHVLRHFGETRSLSRDEFIRWVHKKLEAEADADAIEKAASKGIYGSTEFVEALTASDAPKRLTKPEGQMIPIEQVLETVCRAYSLKPDDLCGAARTKDIVDARSVLALLSQLDKYGRVKQAEIARALNKSQGTVSRLVARGISRPDLLDKAKAILKETSSSE